jgi:hypothetical protein
MGSLPSPAAPPFYETNLFLFGAGTTISVVLTVVAAMKHDLRWLLVLAWPFAMLAVLAGIRATKKSLPFKIVTLCIGGVLAAVVLVGIGIELKPDLAPSPSQVATTTPPALPPEPILDAVLVNFVVGPYRGKTTVVLGGRIANRHGPPTGTDNWSMDIQLDDHTVHHGRAPLNITEDLPLTTPPGTQQMKAVAADYWPRKTSLPIPAGATVEGWYWSTFADLTLEDIASKHGVAIVAFKDVVNGYRYTIRRAISAKTLVTPNLPSPMVNGPSAHDGEQSSSPASEESTAALAIDCEPLVAPVNIQESEINLLYPSPMVITIGKQYKREGVFGLWPDPNGEFENIERCTVESTKGEKTLVNVLIPITEIFVKVKQTSDHPQELTMTNEIFAKKSGNLSIALLRPVKPFEFYIQNTWQYAIVITWGEDATIAGKPVPVEITDRAKEIRMFPKSKPEH